MVPKCTSWLGHRFEARYSKSPAARLNHDTVFWSFTADLPALMEKSRTVTYECDVCVRCGYVVQPDSKNK